MGLGLGKHRAEGQAPGADETAETSVPAEPGATSRYADSGVPSAAVETARPAEPAAEPASVGAAEPGAPDERLPVSVWLAEAAGDLEGPLLRDVPGLRASWQRIQTGFVDDPAEAVADAADLVEHTVQALAGALQHRQRLLRAMWDRGRSPAGLDAAASGSPDGAESAGVESAGAAGAQPAADGALDTEQLDTEQLRLLIQRYRNLFNDICRP